LAINAPQTPEEQDPNPLNPALSTHHDLFLSVANMLETQNLVAEKLGTSAVPPLADCAAAAGVEYSDKPEKLE